MATISHKTVKSFLEKNGFEIIDNDKLSNNACVVYFLDEHYCISHNGFDYYTPDLTIYTLIGYLTYNNLLNKNYKNL